MSGLTLADLVDSVGKNISAAAGQASGSSYDDLAGIARADFLCILSSDLLSVNFVDALLQSSLNIITGYYIRALPFAMDDASADVVKVLKRLKPSVNYDYIKAADSLGNLNIRPNLQGLCDSATNMASIEDAYKFGLPISSTAYSTEASKNIELNSDVDESTSLSVGKLVEVDLQFGKDNTRTVTVALNLSTIPTTPDVTEKIMVGDTVDNSLVERWYKLQTGRITRGQFWTGIDIAKKKKKLKLEDEHGILESVNARRRQGIFNAFVSGERSYGDSTNILIVSKDIMKRVERAHRSKIANPETRDRIFSEVGIMVLYVVDTVYERVDIYFRGLPNETSVSIKTLVKKSKKDGPDIEDMIKALSMNKSPSF